LAGPGDLGDLDDLEYMLMLYILTRYISVAIGLNIQTAWL